MPGIHPQHCEVIDEMKVGYKTIPFAMNRRMAAAGAAVASERNTIHGITISEPRRIMREYRQQTGERRSLTAYVIACLARVVAENPVMNSFRRGRKLILLDDVWSYPVSVDRSGLVAGATPQRFSSCPMGIHSSKMNDDGAGCTTPRPRKWCVLQ